ncbi:MAG: hypothetical protein DMF71_15175, partial [Acidobacteria bacterium]
MPALRARRAFASRNALTLRTQYLSFGLLCLILLALNSVAQAQGGASPVSKSFDFRNGALGWQAGFADYPPATD